MIIKINNYIGTIKEMKQIKENMYFISIFDFNDAIINITCDIHEIRIVDCIANYDILRDIKITKNEMGNVE